MSNDPDVTPEFTTGIAELTLQSKDIEALERFYTSALGLKVLSREDDRIWLSCGPRSRLGLWLPGKKEFGDRGGAHVHFALKAERGGLRAATARLRELEIPFEGPIEHPGGDLSIYLRDPEDNVVEVWDFFEEEAGADGVNGLAG